MRPAHDVVSGEVGNCAGHAEGTGEAARGEVQFFGGFSPSAIPSSWLLAGTWRYQHRVVLVPTGLSFYALNEAARARLTSPLRPPKKYT